MDSGAVDRGLVNRTGVPRDCYGSEIALFLQEMTFITWLLASQDAM
jgi:hypothetical protein